MTTEMRAPLDGVVVLEYGEGVAAAFATRLLADLGADVVKVEPPGGDRTRLEGYVPDGANASTLFAYVNAGKRGEVLDTATEAGRARLRDLVEAADVVVDSHAPAHWEQLGMRLDDLPGNGKCRLAVSITPFGRFGERAGWAANHLTVHHTGGEAYAFPGGIGWIRHPDREPIRVPGRVADLDAGWCAAIAILGFLRGDRSPSTIELSVQEAATALSRQDMVKFPNDGFFDTRATRAIPVLGMVECKDGWMEVYPTEQPQWERLVQAVGDPEWAHALGETADMRIQHTEELNDLFAVWLMERTKAEIYPALRTEGVPSGPVRTPRELLDCEQMRYRGFYQPIAWPAGKTSDVPAHPYTLRTPDGGEWRPGPAGAAPPPSPSAASVSPSPATSSAPRIEQPAQQPVRWLDGVRVVDLTWYQAGPYCNMILASLGAEVIKVESLNRVDPFRRSRRQKAVMLEDLKGDDWLNTGYRFNEVNLGKLGVQLNLAHPRGRELLKQLVATADVVVESFRSGTMDRLGLSFAELIECNPKLVMLSLSANGAGGPDGHLSGYAAVFGATSGLSGLSGYDSSLPSEYRGPLDQRVGTSAAFAVLAGLATRDRTDSGVHIDFAAQEAGTTLIGDQLLEWQLRGRTDEPLGNHHPEHAPHNCYTCVHEGEPGWLTLAVETDEQWQRLVHLVGAPELDATWDREARKANEATIDEAIATWMRERERDEMVAQLQERSIPSSPTMSAKDLYEDAHLRSRGMWTTVDHERMGRIEVVSMPWLVNHTRPALTAAPIVGEDNDYVYRDILGISEGDIEQLVAEGVIH